MLLLLVFFGWNCTSAPEAAAPDEDAIAASLESEIPPPEQIWITQVTFLNQQLATWEMPQSVEELDRFLEAARTAWTRHPSASAEAPLWGHVYTQLLLRKSDSGTETDPLSLELECHLLTEYRLPRLSDELAYIQDPAQPSKAVLLDFNASLFYLEDACPLSGDVRAQLAGLHDPYARVINQYVSADLVEDPHLLDSLEQSFRLLTQRETQGTTSGLR